MEDLVPPTEGTHQYPHLVNSSFCSGWLEPLVSLVSPMPSEPGFMTNFLLEQQLGKHWHVEMNSKHKPEHKLSFFTRMNFYDVDMYLFHLTSPRMCHSIKSIKTILCDESDSTQEASNP